MSLIVNWRQIPPRIPLESARIPEFRLIPADSLDSPQIPGGISGGMKSIGKEEDVEMPDISQVKV